MQEKKKLTVSATLEAVMSLLQRVEAAESIIEEKKERPDTTTLEEVMPLLQRLEAGESITEEERDWLGSLRGIVDEDLERLRLQRGPIPFTNSHLRRLIGLAPNLEKLDLDKTEVSDLAPLAELKGLRNLNLSRTQISDLSPLAELKELQTLDLSYIQISDLSPLVELKELSFLYLSHTQISDLSPLAELKELQNLYLSDTQIRDLSPLVELKELRSLDLSDTQIRDFSPLAELKELLNLDLSHTQIRDLSPLAELKELLFLILSDTPVRSLAPLHKSSELSWLVLGGLHLDTLPRFCVREGLHLYLEGTTFSRQPEALFHLPTEQILSTYYDVPHVKINEGKVIFLGNEDAGKTHTILRIRSHGEEKDYQTKSTPGVDIQPFDCGEGRTIRFWDFGGQEIMHSMHHCFLTERTCYVVVVRNRSAETPMAQARKWLRTVAGFSRQVSVLLLVNQWHNVTQDTALDIDELKRICPALSDVVSYSAADETQENFNRKVTARILQEVDRLDSVKLELPQSWADIRAELLEMRQDYITMSDYLQVCARHGLGGKDKNSESIRLWLLEWFNDMGVCFSYHKNAPADAEALRNYKVLQPKWLTEGLYRLITNGKECTNSGCVSQEDITSILTLEKPHYLSVDKSIEIKEGDCRYILEVMRKFGRSFPTEDGKVFIPETLNPRQPLNVDRLGTGYGTPLTYTLYLTYLPLGLLHRLMVSLYAYTDGVIWRRGVRLRDCGDDTVLLVDCQEDQNWLRFRLFRRDNGKDYCPLFHQARQLALRYLQEMRLVLEKAEVRRDEGSRAAVYDIKTLLDAWKQNSKAQLFYNQGQFAPIPLSDLLEPLFPADALDGAQRLAGLTGTEVSAALTHVCAVYPFVTEQTLSSLTEQQADKLKNELAARRDVDFTRLPPLVLLGAIQSMDGGFSHWLEEHGTRSTKKEGRTIPVLNKKIYEGINGDLIQWSLTSELYGKAIGAGTDPNQDTLADAMHPDSTKRYKGTYALMTAIWHAHPELGLGPDYELLAELEHSGSYYSGYRDHTTHMFKVFLLGLYLYENSEKLRTAITAQLPTPEEFLSVWILTALYHDNGYLIETEEGCWDSEAAKAVLKRFNESLDHPLTRLFPEQMDTGTEDGLKRRYHLQMQTAEGQYEIEQKLPAFRGIGPQVQLSMDDAANPIADYYSYASRLRKGRLYYDHGIISACMLLFTCDAVCDYLQQSKKCSFYPELQEKRDAFLASAERYKEFAHMAAEAIALHNIQKKWDETETADLLLKGVTIRSFCIPLEKLPIAYLLRVCDELQCWDRQSFSNPLGKNARTPLDADKLSLEAAFDRVSLSVKDEKKRTALAAALEGVLNPPLSDVVELKG